MANEQQLSASRDQAREKLDALLAMNVKEIALDPRLGLMNFKDAIPTIDRVMGLFSMLKGVSLDYLSHQRLHGLMNAIDQAISHLKQIEAYTIDVSNPKEQRDSIIAGLQNQYESWFELLSGNIAFAIRGSSDFAALERDLRAKIANAEVTAKELLNQQMDAAKQAQETLSAIRKTAAEAGVSQQAIYFKNEADKHETTATKWLKATAVMTAVTALWGGYLLWFLVIPANVPIPQLVQQTVGKLIILSGFWYALVWCARNYRANQHNFIINRHKQNALSTFETFVKAASSDDVKQAVLLQTTASIFSNQPSGYTAKDAETEQPSRVIEILRSATSLAKPPG